MLATQYGWFFGSVHAWIKYGKAFLESSAESRTGNVSGLSALQSSVECSLVSSPGVVENCKTAV
jgi:hypothetical protein